MFFGATSTVAAVLDRIGEHPKIFVLDFSDVPLVDSSAARELEKFAHKLQKSQTVICFAGARSSVRRTLLTAGLKPPLVLYASDAEDAIAHARSIQAGSEGTGSGRKGPDTQI